MTVPGGILLVTGEEHVMRLTFREQGRAYWAAEFGLILEKHGWLDFEQAAPDILDAPENLDGWAAVIVAWLPEEEWKPEYLAALQRYAGVLLLEGPFPPQVEEFLGVDRAGPPIVGARGTLDFSTLAAQYLDSRFGSSFLIGHRSGPDPGLELSASGDPNPLELAPRESVTRRPGLGRDAFAELGPGLVADNAGRAAVSITLAYRARFARNRRFFDDPVDDALALLACARCIAALPGVGALDDALRRLVREAAGSNRPPVPLEDRQSALARAVWGTALAEAAVALDDTTLAERAKEVVADVRHDWGTAAETDPYLSRWRALLTVELAQASAAARSAVLVGGFVGDAPSPPHPIVGWLDMALERASPGPSPTNGEAREWIQRIADGLEAAAGSQLPKDLEGFATPALMLVLGMLQQASRLPAARRMWRHLVDALYDVRQGLFMGGTVVKGTVVPATGFATSPLVALGLLDAAGPIDIVDAPTQELERYSSDQLDAWAAPPYTFQAYAGVKEPLMALSLQGERWPAIWRRGKRIATSFQVLAHLVHVHTVEPLNEPFSAFRSGDAIALEYLLMHLLGSAIAEAEPAVVTIGPWPWGVRYALTVRHDVDRVLDEGQFRRLLEFEQGHGLAVSWFWLPDRLAPQQLAELEQESGHEIGLHAVRIDQKQRELDLVARGLTKPLAGEAIHGSGDGWLGYLSVRAAADAGLLYTELAPPIADCPYARYPWIDQDGIVRSEQIIGVSYNISIEGKLGTEPGSEGGPGLYRQLLNHPDLNFDRLQNWVRSLPADGRLDWTCEQVARWWQVTHVAGNVSIRHLPPPAPDAISFEVSAGEPIADLELRLPCDPRMIGGVSVDESSAEWSALDEPEHSGVRIRLTLNPEAPSRVTLRLAASAQHRLDSVREGPHEG